MSQVRPLAVERLDTREQVSRRTGVLAPRRLHDVHAHRIGRHAARRLSAATQRVARRSETLKKGRLHRGGVIHLELRSSSSKQHSGIVLAAC